VVANRAYVGTRSGPPSIYMWRVFVSRVRGGSSLRAQDHVLALIPRQIRGDTAARGAGLSAVRSGTQTATLMLPPPSPEAEALIESYLTRAASLTPAEWGRLDAIGSHLAGVSPFALLDRARADGASWGLRHLLPKPLATGAALAGRAAFWVAVAAMLARWALSDPGSARAWPSAEESRRKIERWEAEHPELAPMNKYIARLREISKAQPGRTAIRGWWSNAERVLSYGLLALFARGRSPAPVFEEAYALVEPVIPFRSLA
jgi:hypothetical protein